MRGCPAHIKVQVFNMPGRLCAMRLCDVAVHCHA